MHCPRCRLKYPGGVSECPGCQVPLAPESLLDIVMVFESNDRFSIGLAKGLLEDSKIPFWTEDDETAARLVLSPIMFPACRFLVPKDHEAEARDILGSLERG